METYKPQKKTADMLDRAWEMVENAPYDVTARWLFYGLLQEGYYSTKGDYKNRFMKALSKARHSFYKKWRPNTLVDGTREAVRRASFLSISAVVESMDDEKAYTQQLAENESRENVPLEEQARGYRYGQETFGWSQQEIARRAGTHQPGVHRSLVWLNEYEQGTSVIRSYESSANWTGIDHTVQLVRSLGDDTASKKEVAKKVTKENLTALQTRQVAKVYKAAESI